MPMSPSRSHCVGFVLVLFAIAAVLGILSVTTDVFEGDDSSGDGGSVMYDDYEWGGGWCDCSARLAIDNVEEANNLIPDELYQKWYDAYYNSRKTLCSCMDKATNETVGEGCNYDNVCAVNETIAAPYMAAWNSEHNNNSVFNVTVVCELSCAVPGRPFLDGVTAESGGAGWSSCSAVAPSPQAVNSTSFGPSFGPSFGRKWQKDGLGEHASVASFAKFTLLLLESGAPLELVDWSLRSAREEVVHARLCFDLAVEFGAENVGPGVLEVGELEVGDTAAGGIQELVESTLRDGCFNEHPNAHLVAVRRARYEQQWGESNVLDVLRTIEMDEVRHAALAYRTVAWALSEGEGGYFERREGREETRKGVEGILREWKENNGRAWAKVEGEVDEGGFLEKEEARELRHKFLEDTVFGNVEELLRRDCFVEECEFCR